MTLNNKGFAHLIALLFIVTSIAIGLYLVQHPTFFKPRASESATAVSNSQPSPTLAFVFTGESNSGGLGSNSDATEDELAPTSTVQILNNYSMTFQDLDIGYNNTTDHAYLDPNISAVDHGWELGLANAVKAHAFPNNPQVYLIKTGQGGSAVASWTPDGLFWQKFLQRIQVAKTTIPQPVQWVVWYSLGINDRISPPPYGPTAVATYKAGVLDHINRIKEQLPGAIIIMTQFQSIDAQEFAEYDNALQEIANSQPNVYVVNTTGAIVLGTAAGEQIHWNYAGLKTVASRMVAITQSLILPPNTISATPNPCILNASQLCTATISWNFPGASDFKITVREAPGSLVSTSPFGSQDANWIKSSGATFDAYSAGQLVGSVFVKGVANSTGSPAPSQQGRIFDTTSTTCTLNQSNICTVRIIWNSTYPDLKITVKESPGSLFAARPYGDQEATWITANGATFEAWSGNQKLDSLFVKGVR